MRKLFVHINVSLDGYIEDESQEMDWHFVDDEFEEYSNEMLRSIDGMVFGRVAHQLLATYWPGAAAQTDISPAHRVAIELMNTLPKYVPTRSGYASDWAQSHIIEGDAADFLRRLKQQPGKDIALFAGADTVQSLLESGLIDEFRFVVNPVLLGKGLPLFRPGDYRSDLQLLGVRQFGSGALLLSYAVAGKK